MTIYRKLLAKIALVCALISPSAASAEMSLAERCDLIAFLAIAQYNAKLAKAPYAEARQFLVQQLERVAPPDAATNEGYQNFKVIALNLVAKAYSSHWPNSQAFSDHERALCLGLDK